MPTLSLAVARPDDMLIATVRLVNVSLTPAATPGDPPTVRGAADALIVLTFPAQHVAEQAFYPPGDPPTSPGQVQALLAGPTRLVFSLPAATEFSFTLAGLLAVLPSLNLLVAPVAAFDEATQGCSPLYWLAKLAGQSLAPRIAEPTAAQTALELPYRLILSPDAQGTWRHSATPVDQRPDPTDPPKPVELWHTRLQTRRADGDSRLRPIWSPDFGPTLQGPSDTPFRMSLDGSDRNQLVHLSSNYHIPTYSPASLRTDHLMLTTMGGWLKVQGNWAPPSLPGGGSLTVESWRHITTLGRDQFVRIVRAGYLLPFGHKASLIEITERRFQWSGEQLVAYLFKREFLLVRQPTRDFSHRHLPFHQVTLITLSTPDLDDTRTNGVVANQPKEAFWPMVGLKRFQFILTATDATGVTSTFTAPLIWVSKNVDEKPVLADVLTAYNADADRIRPFTGQPIAFAPSTVPNDTTLDTQTITYAATSRPETTPHFRPDMAEAKITVPSLKGLLGDSQAPTIIWEPTFLTNGGSTIGNAGQVYARFKNTVPLVFGAADKAGGLVAPNMGLGGLSRTLGTVAAIGNDVSGMVGGTFDPAQIFGADVKLLGGISLNAIIKTLISYNVANSNNKIPGLTTERIGDVLRTRYRWQLTGAELSNAAYAADLTKIVLTVGPSAAFTLTAQVDKPLTGGDPTITLDGQLTDITVTLLPAPDSLRLIEIHFKSVSFHSESGKKADVSVQMGAITFLGPLTFVNELSKLIPSDGFSDPPYIELVSDPGVKVGFSIGLPTIGLGILTIMNVSLGAAALIPFVNQPMSIRFNFCEREQPFMLTVALFGGGGFFAIVVSLKGVDLIEAALEFGAAIAINLGVAAGQVSVMGGFYFQKAGDAFELTGYIRINGSLSVLGIVSISVEFYLGLTFASKHKRVPNRTTLFGQARVTVKVKILFFSKSVSLTVEREFAGADPTFLLTVSPDQWATYCTAFADYPVVGEDD